MCVGEFHDKPIQNHPHQFFLVVQKPLVELDNSSEVNSIIPLYMYVYIYIYVHTFHRIAAATEHMKVYMYTHIPDEAISNSSSDVRFKLAVLDTLENDDKALPAIVTIVHYEIKEM